MSEFEKKLKLLFDAQNFFREPKLEAVIRRQQVLALEDEDLAMLSAAGDPFSVKADEKPK